MAMNQRTMRPRASSVTYHAEALAWKTAAEANGGTVTTSTLAAVSTFCNAIDAAGIRDRFLRLNLVCGSNLAAARTPLYRGASLTGTQYGSAADVNNGPFVEVDYSETTGLNGNGSTKYFDTTATIGMLASFGATGTNVHAAVYNRTSTQGPHFGGADDVVDVYAFEGKACFLDLSAFSWSNPIFSVLGYVLDAYVDSNASGVGFWCGEVTSSTTALLTKNGSNVTGTASLTYIQPYNTTDQTPLYFCGAYQSNGDNYAVGRLSAYSVGKAFTSSAQRTAYYTAMQAFQTALGRNV